MLTEQDTHKEIEQGIEPKAPDAFDNPATLPTIFEGNISAERVCAVVNQN